MAEHYQRPGWFTKHVFNRVVAVLTRLGISVAGSRVLEVRGRKTGQWRQTPVNLLALDGARYLVAPRGNTQWVKNLRATPRGRLRVGRRVEEFAAVEISDEDKPAVLRAYLERWKWEVGVFFGGVGPDSSDAELTRIAPDHPAFRIEDHAQADQQGPESPPSPPVAQRGPESPPSPPAAQQGPESPPSPPAAGGPAPEDHRGG